MTMLDDIDAAAGKYRISGDLVAAIVKIESNGNSWAMRYEPGWRYYHDHDDPLVSAATEMSQQATSWGLMQVMGTVARELGCDAPFLSVLCRPSVGLDFGCQFLRKQIDRYDGDLSDAVAAYNAGSARYRDSGEYVNQAYVDKVWRVYRRIRGET